MSVMRVKNVFANFEHDVNICFEYEGKVYSYELERMTRERYFMFCGPDNWGKSFEVLSRFKNILLKEFNVTNISFENLYHNLDTYWGNVSPVPDNFKALFACVNIGELDHHECHAASAFYQSPFEESLVFSYDGGGMRANQRGSWQRPDDWDYTVIYLASMKTGIRRVVKIPVNFGGFYNELCSYPNHVQWPAGSASMAGCGKLMGLSGWWPPDPLLVSKLKSIFLDTPFRHKDGGTIESSDEIVGRVEAFNFPYDINSTNYRNSLLELHHCAMFASNWQEVFTQLILDVLRPYVERYPYPICVTGGCALNVLTNERIRTHFGREVFVPPNPSDCGLGIGGLAIHTDVDISNTVYSNFDILDRSSISNNGDWVAPGTLADKICEGKILGVVNGRSECGPRSLGNRSILCDPSIPDMKDILNKKVKGREWYRPFAPMVRYEDRNKYFVFDGDSPYMSFACAVRETYRDDLPAITHVDGTARIQTVKESDNPLIYEVLTEMERKGNIPVMLNTSFNVKGKPILTTVEDSFWILNNTELDHVYIEGKLF